ncbi:MAG TPA: Ig-like domain-containing protein, partial [Thermoleophilaceae bacterium]|nr:Ig-like domain-containing protein [Thermoleophilaceae bacterium]
SGDFAAFSDYGPWVDLAAPGYEITSTFLAAGTGYSYGYDSGTSYSAALVSGIAMLVRSHEPALSVQQVADRLRSTARDAGPRGRDPYYGSGLVDALGAVGGPLGSAFRSPAGDAREPDGSPARAKAMTDPYFESATISPQGDVDWYRLDSVSPGTIRFEIDSSYALPYPERMDPAAQVFGPDLTPVTAPQQAGDSRLLIDAQAPVAGSYYLKVWNRLGARSQLSPATPWGYTVKHSSGSWPLPLPDLPKAWVRDTFPADFSEGASTAVAPTVVFAHDLDPATVTGAHLKLENGLTGDPVPANVSYGAGNRTATIQPTAALSPGAPYIVTVAGVTDTAGTAMDEPFSFRFTVGTTPDAAPPDTTITFAL